jgi:PAS domain S-box-containing protein
MTEQQIRDTAYLQTIINTIPTAVFIIDHDFNIIDLNPAASKLFSIDSDVTLYRLCGEIMHCMNAANSEGGCGTTEYCPDCVIRNAVEDAIIGNKTHRKRYEMKLSKENNISTIHMLVTASPLDFKGNQFVLMTLEDVTATFKDMTAFKLAKDALHISEEKYRLAMEATTDGLWDWNIETGEVFYSKNWTKLLSEEAVEPKYQTWESRIHPDDKSEVLTSLQFHLEGNSPNWRKEHRLQNSTGDWKWVVGRGKVTKRNSKGSPLRMVGTMTDISERKRADLEREVLIDKLQSTLDEVKTLSGLLPICSSCKKIRDDQGYWNQIEGYIQRHSDAQFSHGICPECAKKLYSDLDL